jgi:ADP-ribosyl-[dinitrogen reductase] hydrolase
MCAVLDRNRYRGSMLGLAVVDALGAPLEFLEPGTFEPICDMIEGGYHDLPRGHWTDDTSHELCLADSLIQCKGFNPTDQMYRRLMWYRNGYLSSTGECFDIGNTTRYALESFEAAKSDYPFHGPTDPSMAGNGSIMGLAPVPLFFAWDPWKAIELCGVSSRTTHGALVCIDACRYLGALILGAVHQFSKDELLSDHFDMDACGFWREVPLVPEVAEVASGSFKRLNPPDIQGIGYVTKCLEAALWAFYNSSTFEEGALLAVNLGDDADTTGAVYGQLAGAYYGVEGIPTAWLDELFNRELIESFADKIHEFAEAM